MIRILAPYWASLRLGAGLGLADKADFIGMMLMYTILILVFASIYSVIPLQELNHPDITSGHLLWYFVLVEGIIIGMQGLQREFGRNIAAGEVTTLMQRPGSMMLLLQARLYGNILINNIALMVFGALFVRFVLGIPSPIAWLHVPWLLLSIVLGVWIYLLLGYMVGMIEIFGPYSTTTGLFLSKMVFTCGGLFFPVMFYPPVLQRIVTLTPFPAIIAVPGNFMLNPTQAVLVDGLLQQIIWLLLIGSAAHLCEKRLMRRVMRTGD